MYYAGLLFCSVQCQQSLPSILSFKRSYLRNRPKSDTCLYELFSSQRPRKSPPAVMSQSRETPCITSNDVQTQLPLLMSLLIFGFSIHKGIIIRPSLKYTDPLHKTIKTRFGIPTIHSNLCLWYTYLCYYCSTWIYVFIL